MAQRMYLPISDAAHLIEDALELRHRAAREHILRRPRLCVDDVERKQRRRNHFWEARLPVDEAAVLEAVERVIARSRIKDV
jgi:hypothetical protein